MDRMGVVVLEAWCLQSIVVVVAVVVVVARIAVRGCWYLACAVVVGLIALLVGHIVGLVLFVVVAP